MSVRTLPYPADLRRQLRFSLPGGGRDDHPHAVQVTPRTADGRKSSVWAADFYEVAAYYVTSDPALLGSLEDALRAIPGVYRTTRVAAAGDHTEVQDRSWPVGSTRRDKALRVQVLALMRDPADSTEREEG